MVFSPAFILTLVVNVLFWSGTQVLFPVIPLYITSLGGTPADNGLATLATAGTAVVARLFIGALADRMGRKPVILLGGICGAVVPLLYGASHALLSLVAARALAGIGIAAFTTGFQALLADLVPPEKRGEAFGWGGNSAALASLLGPITGAWIISRWGFLPAFDLAAFSGALCALAAFFIREPPGSARQTTGSLPLQGMRETLALHSVRMSVIATCPLGLAFGTIFTFWPLVAQQNHLNTVGVFYSVYALGMLAVQTLAGRLSDRIGRTRVLLPGMLLAGVALAMIPAARSDGASLLVAFACGAGLGIARTAIDALALDGVPGALRGTAVAIEFTNIDLWVGLGSALMGSLAGLTGYSAAYAVAGGACVATAGVLAVVRRRTSAT